MKNLNYNKYIGISLIIMSLIANTTHAKSSRDRDERASRDKSKREQPQVYVTNSMSSGIEQTEVLKSMQESMTTQMATIEALLSQEQYGSAMSAAKTLLDTVKTKMGLDPKVKTRQPIPVDANFQRSGLFSQAPSDLKNIIILTIRDYRAGLYVDIINLFKRTVLLYSKALTARMNKDGGLTSVDRDKVIKDLTSATIIQIDLIDKSGNTITAFDDEILDEDHVYLFNREIQQFLAQNPNLNFSVQDYTQYQQALKRSLSTVGSGSWAFNDPNYIKCKQRAGYLPTIQEIQDQLKVCVDRYSISVSSFDECKEFASDMPTIQSINAKTRQCFDKFKHEYL